MSKKELSVPKNRNYEYSLNQALAITSQRLASADTAEICRKSGAELYDNGISLNYLNTIYRITSPNAEIATENEDRLPLKEKILLLHYLMTAKGTPLSNKQIAFRELPEGALYYRSYNQRTLKPLATFFGKEPVRLIEVAQKIGGQKAEPGDASVTINAFPKVPITFVIWKGDNEFPPEVNIIFDSTITDYLPVEDITVICEIITWKMVRSLKT